MCVKCGVRQGSGGGGGGGGRKSKSTALILCLFLCGFHYIYVGKTGMAILFWLTGGGCGIWWIIDLIAILNGSFKDADGKSLV